MTPRLSLLALLAAVALLHVVTYTQAESTYLGCFKDKFTPAERDLGAMVALEETRMTPAFCESVCGARHQYKYFGLQYGMECWCGNEYGKYGEFDQAATPGASGCVTPCSGDASQKCGGENLNSVYEITTQYPPPQKHADGRPLLALVMIVKDEAHTLPQTLLAIKPWIDVYYILDTGSTDGTQDAIRRTLGADKGEIWEEPFIDYGRSRNRALEIAATSKNLGGPPIFSLMLSADETVHNGAGLRTFCEEHRDRDGPAEEAYYIQMDVGWKFDSARLSRTDKGWRYQGRVHEYLAGPKGYGAPTLRIPEAYIKFKVTDETRRAASEYTILRILQEETREKPKDTRASFYLARTYNVVKNHTAALAEFKRRVSLGGWREEVYESLYAIAWQKEALHAPWWEVQQAFLDAHAHSPERAEPLYAVASHWYREKQPSLAWIFASHAATLTYPYQASLWVQADVYSWQCWFIMGMTGIDIKKEREGYKALQRALAKRPQDAGMQQQLAKYRQVLNDEVRAQLDCELEPTKEGCAGRTLTVMPLPHELIQAGGGDTTQQPSALAVAQAAAAARGNNGGGGKGFLYFLLFCLFLSNLAFAFALARKSRAMAACLPTGMAGLDKQV